MTWHTTHLRSAALGEVERLAATQPDADLPWRGEWEQLFDGRDGLAQALRYRLRLRLQAQVDPSGGADPAAVRRTAATIHRRWANLEGMLARYASTRPRPEVSRRAS